MHALLMGGQACILYGAAEFSRDTDLAVLASPANLGRLPSVLRVRFWLRELRTPELLVEAARRWPKARAALEKRRPLLRLARVGGQARLADALAAEEKRERRADALYWAPLKAEIEALRLERARLAASPSP